MATDTSSAAVPEQDAILDALATVNDPEIHRPITELGMVKSVEIGDGGEVAVTVYLTVSGCPMRETITKNVTEAVERVPGVTSVAVTLDVMSDEQRKDLAATLRGGTAEREVPFAKPGSLTRVYAVASGKGGVGKSSVTVNLAAAMAADGLKVGVVDADIYGHSVPRMLGVEGRPTQVENMIMPPSANGVKVISIGMFTPATRRWCGAVRCSTARCSSSWRTCSGATWTCSCWTCRRGRATSRSRWPSWCRTRRSWS